MRLRPMNPGDAAKCEAVDATAFDAPIPRQLFAQVAELWHGLSYVAEVEGRLVGYVLCGQWAGSDADARVVSLAVAGDHRGQGIGRALLSQVQQGLAARGVLRCDLLVEPENPAQRLYLRHGFREQQRLVDPLGDGADRLRMVWDRAQGAADGAARSKAVDAVPHSFEDTSYHERLDADALRSEAQVGTQFVSILFAVSAIGAALAAGAGGAGASLPLLALLLITILGSMLAALFYANVSGDLRRGRQEALVPMRYGNVLSEYAGVLPLMAAVPLLAHQLTGRVSPALFALTITLMALVGYQASRFDISRRFWWHQPRWPILPRFYWPLTAGNAFSVAAVTAADVWAESWWWAAAALALLLMLLVLQTIVGLIGSEDREGPALASVAEATAEAP